MESQSETPKHYSFFLKIYIHEFLQHVTTYQKSIVMPNCFEFIGAPATPYCTLECERCKLENYW